MSELILIKHSQPEVVTGVPASRWQLSPVGRSRSVRLGLELLTHQPSRVVTSVEPKAVETGQIVAGVLNIPWETLPGLHEHVRPDPVQTLDQEAFEARVAALFEYPDQLVFGAETANQALERFSAALSSVMTRYQDETLAVVAHGTVITLYISRATRLEPTSFWRRLGLPSFVVLSLPNLRLEKVVEGIPDSG